MISKMGKKIVAHGRQTHWLHYCATKIKAILAVIRGEDVVGQEKFFIFYVFLLLLNKKNKR